tara:strand:+ start:336 stop:3167 length:2832 start_codon:yes stop_codon:yes gene_type:complete
MKKIILIVFLLATYSIYSQVLTWESFVDSIPTLSSPRPADLNNDGVLDIVIGGGTEGEISNSGVMAFDGTNGSLLWKAPSRSELYGSPVFYDVNNDGTEDVFITGREAQFLAFDGNTGTLLWDFFPYETNPADSGWYNFYNPQFIDDVNSDGFKDLIVTNGGDYSAPEWETDRPPGYVLVVSSTDGEILSQVAVPDSAETYCSPIVCDLQGNGIRWVLFGTGGENLGGHFYACPLSSILDNTMSGAVILAADSSKGFIAPPSIVLNEATNTYDVFVLSYGGKLQKFSGADFSEQWSFQYPNTESSAAPVIGNFTADHTPDVFLTLFKGIAPSFSDFYQIMLDGSNGDLKFIDSLGQLNYASGNAIDLNNDGRDEAVTSLTYVINGYFEHRLEKIDFATNIASSLTPLNGGVNLGSTPLFTDLDQDGNVELIYASRYDSINPVAWNGIVVSRIDLGLLIPNSGIAWGSYIGTAFNGLYSNTAQFCGDNAVVNSATIIDPSCNGFLDGSISINVTGSYSPYVYHWTNGVYESSLINLNAGSYSLRITDASGCYEDLTYQLDDPYEITYGAISSPGCIGGSDGSATMSSSGCPCMFSTCTFLWENGITTKPNDSLVSGWNTVIVTHPDGCIVEDSVFIPAATSVVDSVQIENAKCFQEQNGQLTLLMDSLYVPYEFLWFNGDTLNFIDSLSAGIYDVWVQDSRGCIDTLDIQIVEPDVLSLQSEHSEFLCADISNGIISFIGDGGTAPYSYQINLSTVEDTSLSNLSAGSYTISVTDSNACQTDQILEIIELEPLSASFETVPVSETGAFNGAAIATPSGGLPPYTYYWSSFHVDSSAVYLNSAWYSVVITDSIGCTFEDSVFVGIVGLGGLDVFSFEAYPNPTTGAVYLSQSCQQIELYSQEGKLVLTKLNSDFIDLSSLVNGLYYLSLRNKHGIQQVPIVRISN